MLSEVGRQQSTRLGSWLSRRGVRFSRGWSGRLARQKETGECVRTAYLMAGVEFPEIVPHPSWDEFDLDAVYRSIGPQLARDDAEFARQYEELQVQMRDAVSSVHRTWSPCDTAVVRAWIDRRYECEGESFEAFAERVRSARELFADDGKAGNIAVFTSATPAAVWAALALDLDGRRIMQLAGVSYNTSLSVMRVEQERVRLFQFNTVPHLDTPDLLTHR